MNTRVKMEIKMIVIVLYFMFAITSATMVNLTSGWKTNSGWEITCSWRLFANDSLQSVRLMDHERQFLIYRPESNGPSYKQRFHFPEKEFLVDCNETSQNGVMGQCVMTLELFQPVTSDMRYSCEVSGERPKFRVESKYIEIAALVSPSDAEIVVAQRDSSGSRVVLNCTSSGLPAPSLLWSIGEQRVPHDFSGKSWNVTSKLWDSWSLLSFPSNNLPATCIPETNKAGHTVTGRGAEYSAACGNTGTFLIISGALSLLALTR